MAYYDHYYVQVIFTIQTLVMQLGETLCFVPFFFVNHFAKGKECEPDNTRKPMNLLVLLPVSIMFYFTEYQTNKSILIYLLGFALGYNISIPWLYRSWFHEEWWFLHHAESDIYRVLCSSLHPNFEAETTVVQLDWDSYHVWGYHDEISSIYHKQSFPSI